MRVSRLVVASLLLLAPLTTEAQAVQAIRSLGRAQEEMTRDSISAAAGRLTARIGALRAYQAMILQSGKSELLGYATLLGDLERLGQQALDQRDDPREFVRRVNEFNRAAEALTGFQQRADAAIADADSRNLIAALDVANKDPNIGILVVPPAVFQYVPSVVFTTGLGVTSRFNEKYAFPVTVSTNLLGQLSGAVLNSFGDNALSRYVQDNVVVGAVLHAGSAGKPSGQLTLGLGEVRTRKVALWPVLGMEQTDTADNRVPRTLIERRPTTGTWTTPMVGIAFTAGDLKKYVEGVRAGGARPLMSLGVRFPYFYPGNTLDALSALFSDRISKYDRAAHEQYFVSIDLPLLKVDPSKLLPGH